MLTLARALGRTKAELLYGSGAFRPLTHAEWVDWMALYDLEAKELEAAQRKASKPRRKSASGSPAPRTLERARTEGDD
jgi:hypothetical protein